MGLWHHHLFHQLQHQHHVPSLFQHHYLLHLLQRHRHLLFCHLQHHRQPSSLPSSVNYVIFTFSFIHSLAISSTIYLPHLLHLLQCRHTTFSSVWSSRTTSSSSTHLSHLFHPLVPSAGGSWTQRSDTSSSWVFVLWTVSPLDIKYHWFPIMGVPWPEVEASAPSSPPLLRKLCQRHDTLH